jgi:predicted amidohydrolase
MRTSPGMRSTSYLKYGRPENSAPMSPTFPRPVSPAMRGPISNRIATSIGPGSKQPHATFSRWPNKAGSGHPGLNASLDRSHKPHDCVYVINSRGMLLDRYDKMFCSGDGNGRSGDLAHYSPGDHFTTFTLKGIRCGVLICYEYAFPELYREYKRRGVQLVFHSFRAGHASRKTVKSMAREVGIRFHRLNAGSSYPEIRMPASVQAAATANHLWVSCSNTSARQSCFSSFFVRADGIITGRLRRNVAGVLVSTVDTNERLYDGTRGWRDRAMRGTFHSGTPVRDRRSNARTQL